MTLSFTCQCGKKLRIRPDQAGKTVVCPGCRAKVQAPLAEEEEILLLELATPESAIQPEEEEVKLQELKYDEGSDRAIAQLPSVVPVPEKEEEGGSYDFDANDGRTNLDVGSGMYGTIALIRLEEPATCIAYGCKGDWALAAQEQDVLVVNMKAKKAATRFEDHEASISSVAMSMTAPLAVSGDEDGVLRSWKVPSCKPIKRIRAHEDTINAIALSPDGTLAATGGDDGCVHLWEIETGRRRKLEYSDWEEWEEVVTYVSFSRDGSKLLAGGSGGRICLWAVDTGERIKRFAGLELPISCARLSDEGGKVTATTMPIHSGGLSYLVICHWDVATGKPTWRYNLAVESVPCLVAPDRGGVRVLLAGGGSDPWMGVWSLENGHCLHIYDSVRGSPLSLAVSPLNNRVLAALETNRLQLFGLEPF